MSQEMQACPNCGDHVPNEYVVCVWCGFDLTAEKIRRAGIDMGTRESIERMRRVVLEPNSVFKEIALLPDLRGGKMIFYAIGVMITFNMLAIFSKLQGLDINADEQPGYLLSETSSFRINSKFLINLLFIIIQPLILLAIFIVVWKIAARILSLLSRSVGGKGDREKIRAVVGYSMLPVLFGWTMAWLIRLITPGVQVIAENQDQVDAAAEQDLVIEPIFSYEGVQTALISVTEQGFGIVAIIFIYIGWIWTIGLGIIGMKHAGRLSWIEAVIVAGIPYVLFMTIIL